MGRLVKVLVKGIQMSVGPSVLLPQALLWDQFQSIQALKVLFILIVTVKLTPPTPDFLRSRDKQLLLWQADWSPCC